MPWNTIRFVCTATRRSSMCTKQWLAVGTPFRPDWLATIRCKRYALVWKCLPIKSLTRLRYGNPAYWICSSMPCAFMELLWTMPVVIAIPTIRWDAAVRLSPRRQPEPLSITTRPASPDLQEQLLLSKICSVWLMTIGILTLIRTESRWELPWNMPSSWAVRSVRTSRSALLWTKKPISPIWT